MRTRYIAALTFVSFVLSSSPAQAQEGQKPKPWKGSVELSYLTTNGNTKSTTISNRDRFAYESGPMLVELEAGAFRNKTRDVLNERYDASEKVGYKWSDKDYVYEKFRWDKDRISGVNDRFELNAGLGRKLLETKADKLIAELGAGRVWEDRLPPAAYNAFTSGRAFARYERALSATSGFGQEVEYLHNFDRPRDFRLKSETSLTAALTQILSMKMAFLWRRMGRPPANFTRDDTTFSLGLLVSL